MSLNDNNCNECGSTFIPTSSSMMSLCSECAYILYDYPKCEHKIASGYCIKCGWDGSVSKYVQGLKERAENN
jgi:predicted RNA-binding Zn-ribbon protein involved in translation (DUF1610 family)